MPAHLKPSDFALAARLTSHKLYEWQNKCMDAVAAGYQTALCAPNGSGKSSTVVTFLILWFLHEYPRGRVIVTSGSWSQLENQVFTSLKNFATHEFFKDWEFLDTSIKTPAGGSCEGISVNDSKKAVGYHKDENSPVLLIIDEASAVFDPVFESFGKCSPTFQLITGTAGAASGRFYRLFTSEAKFWFTTKIDFRDCPHLSDTKRMIDLEIYGSDSIFYKNRWLSAFASDAGESVISLDAIRECVAYPPAWEQPGFVTCGCDFAAGGGNLCVLCLARGNKIELDEANWCWSHANTNHSAGKFVTLFRELKLQSHQIFADGDGLGRGFVDNLEECDFYVREMHNGAAAKDSDRYASIVAEQWDQLNTLIVKRRIILPACEELFAQLSNRRREYSIKDGLLKIKLESKADMRARNVSSPDLADAAVLALMNGWGSLPGNLNPAGDKRMRKELERVNRTMEHYRSPFATRFIDFSRGW
jgi:hypothetical protein